MPHTVEQLRVLACDVRQAYVLLVDGVSLAFTSDASGELLGSGGSTFIARAETDAFEPTGSRTMVAGLIVPDTLSFGGDLSSIGLDRTTARFSIPLAGAEDIFLLGGEDPDEMLGHLPPTTDPAPASVVGVTVRDRYVGLEFIDADGERRMFPAIMGESLPGFDHHGDTDGATVPAAVSERPLVHEGRMVALYRVYRDPSALSSSGSLAWPSLSNYEAVWVGKMRDAGKLSAGGRISIECTGCESLLERTMATGGGEPFGIRPEFSTQTGVDDQVAVSFSTSETIAPDLTATARTRCQGRDWTTLAGSDRFEVSAALQVIISGAVDGSTADYETGLDTFEDTTGGDAGLSGESLYVQRDQHQVGEDYTYLKMTVAMHRRRWLSLGFDPAQQDWPSGVPVENQSNVYFKELDSGDEFIPETGDSAMGVTPGTGYYSALFTSMSVGGTKSAEESRDTWDNAGAPRLYDPLFPGADTPHIINITPGQIVRMDDDVALLPQTHIPLSGSIGGTDCDGAGFFLIKGNIRRAEGSTDEETLVVSDEHEQLVVARCSWVIRDGLFATADAGTPQVFVEQYYDPRTFGHASRPLDRDWAAQDLVCRQIFSWAIGTAAGHIEQAGQTLSALLRSTGTSTGPDGAGIVQQGTNSGDTTGFYGDIFSAEMGLGIPSSLLPSRDDIESAMDTLPSGHGAGIGRCRPVWEGTFGSAEVIRALLEPRGLRVGFDGRAFNLYRLEDASPEDATVNILESDLYGPVGDPTSVVPEQDARALPPIDAWEFSYGERTHRVDARDHASSTRRGGNVPAVNARGLIAPELYLDNPSDAPVGVHWKNDARVMFGQHAAAFAARRHGMVTVQVSRPKGQDLYPGTLVTLSNPWVYGADGTRGVSGVVGRVIRATHHTRSAHVTASIIVFEGQHRPPPMFAPMLRIQSVASSTSLTIATASDFGEHIGTTSGWVQPPWSTSGSGNAILSLWRALPSGAWSLVGNAEVASVSPVAVTLATAMPLPPNHARTMVATLAPMALQPDWALDIYSAVGEQGDNTRTRRFA